MQEHWRVSGPPAYMSIAARYGFTGKAKAKTTAPGNLEELAAMFSGSGGSF